MVNLRSLLTKKSKLEDTLAVPPPVPSKPLETTTTDAACENLRALERNETVWRMPPFVPGKRRCSPTKAPLNIKPVTTGLSREKLRAAFDAERDKVLGLTTSPTVPTTSPHDSGYGGSPIDLTHPPPLMKMDSTRTLSHPGRLLDFSAPNANGRVPNSSSRLMPPTRPAPAIPTLLSARPSTYTNNSWLEEKIFEEKSREEKIYEEMTFEEKVQKLEDRLRSLE